VTDLPKDGSVRVERARSDFIRGVVRPDAPGMVYYPSIAELAATYDLVETVIARTAREDNWLGARSKAMNTSLVTPFSAAVDADPEIVKRSEIVAKKMETFDDKVFGIADRAMAIAEKAMSELEQEEDPIKAIRALRSLAQTMESFHRTAKTAYDPASIRPEHTVNILSLNQVEASDAIVGKVAQILAQVKQDAIASGVAEEDIAEAEIINDEDDGSSGALVPA
jgi:hypothetical protein